MIKRAVRQALLLVLLVAACRANEGPPLPDVLNQRVHDYYALEQQSDWRGTYEFRTPAYRKSVSKELYISQMRKESDGWHLVKFSIDSKVFRDGKMYFRMTFVETPPSDYLEDRVPPEAKPKTVETVDESIWVYRDNTWYLYSSGSRGRFSLSDAVGS